MENVAKKTLKIASIAILALLLLSLVACNDVWGGDSTQDNPDYAIVDGKQLYFTLELRMPGSSTEVSEGDSFAHSTIDGDLICQWQIPCYGKTVYESIVKFFEDRNDKITFRLSQHRYYMFHDATLENGDNYNLETVYVAADGKYAMCANFQTLFGEDEQPGTLDDLKVLVLVYQGWLY